MRCKTCDYSLWNLKARQCPECGTPFVPSDFDFVINSVRFCCPHCEQAYYGTSARGHLVPEIFNCVNCGNRITMNEMMLRPAEGVDESQTQVNRMPWLERQRRGWFKAWIATVGRSMGNPAGLMRSVPADAPIGPAWLFALLTFFLIYAVGAGLPLIAISIILFANHDRDAMGAMFGGLGVMIGAPVTMAIMIAIWGALAHAMLKITGGSERSIAATYQSLLYSAGTCLPLATPCVGPYCGGYLLWIWWCIAGTLMLAASQRVHGGRAALAVFTGPMLLVGAIVLSYTLLIVGLATSSRSSLASYSPTSLNETSTVTTALIGYAQTHGGNGPAYALELASDSSFGTGNFISSTHATDSSKIKVADTTLDQIEFLPPNRRTIAIQAAAANLPANVVAHRVGDFVFTYHGITLGPQSRSLWAVVYSPDPDQNGSAAARRITAIGLADGTTIPMLGNYRSVLIEQNRLRAKLNLPPLPDPATVTVSKPAVSTGPADAAENP